MFVMVHFFHTMKQLKTKHLWHSIQTMARK